MDIAIRVEDLRKSYTRRRRGEGFLGGLKAYFSVKPETIVAVDGPSFEIRRGESVGLIGENGAGKSTTVKMLTGILVPTSGKVETLGLAPFRERRRLAMNIGVVFGQKPQLLWDIPAGESFKLLKAMYQIPDEVYRYTYGEAVERLELGELLKTPVRMLSLGQRMRCDLAAALLHAPLVAFLDEPTIGLDVLVKERVRDFLREMRRRFGTTILLTTHDLKDITTTCDRLLVLDRGTLLYDGHLPGFLARYGGDRTLNASLSREPDPESRLALEREVQELGGRVVWEGARSVRVDGSGAGMAPRLTAALLRHLSIEDLSLHAAEIDQVVAKLYQKGSRTP